MIPDSFSNVSPVDVDPRDQLLRPTVSNANVNAAFVPPAPMTTDSVLPPDVQTPEPGATAENEQINAAL